MRKGATVVVVDNLDLQMRRKRLGLTQSQLAAILGISGKQPHVSISLFETSNRVIPGGMTRSDVERALDTYEKGLRAGGKGGAK